jgi:hypothetical protein
MDLEKRVAAIEQKLGISSSTDSPSTDSPSTDSPSTDSPSTMPTSMDTASMDTASAVTASAVTAPIDAASAMPTSIDSAPIDAASAMPTSMDTAPIDTASTDTTLAMLPSTNVIPSTDMSPLPESTIISLNGYNGTLKDLFSKIRSKISDLDRAMNKGRYSSRVTELKTLFGNLMKATTVQDIQSTIGTKLKFKNDNSLMGGKSKRRSRKTKKSNKSKRR